MVVTVILILAGITFGISRGVQNAQARTKAKAELAVISQALEQFRLRYGDYPWHDSNTGEYPSSGNVEVTSTMMLYALTGRLKVERRNGNITVFKVADSLDDREVEDAPKFLDVTKFNFTGTNDQPEALIDPWGNPYIYWYKWEDSPNAWEVFGYHLYSTGPNGEAANDAIKGKITESTGELDRDFREVSNEEGIIFASE